MHGLSSRSPRYQQVQTETGSSDSDGDSEDTSKDNDDVNEKVREAIKQLMCGESYEPLLKCWRKGIWPREGDKHGSESHTEIALLQKVAAAMDGTFLTVLENFSMPLHLFPRVAHRFLAKAQERFVHGEDHAKRMLDDAEGRHQRAERDNEPVEEIDRLEAQVNHARHEYKHRRHNQAIEPSVPILQPEKENALEDFKKEVEQFRRKCKDCDGLEEYSLGPRLYARIPRLVKEKISYQVQEYWSELESEKGVDFLLERIKPIMSDISKERVRRGVKEASSKGLRRKSDRKNEQETDHQDNKMESVVKSSCPTHYANLFANYLMVPGVSDELSKTWLKPSDVDFVIFKKEKKKHDGHEDTGASFHNSKPSCANLFPEKMRPLFLSHVVDWYRKDASVDTRQQKLILREEDEVEEYSTSKLFEFNNDYKCPEKAVAKGLPGHGMDGYVYCYAGKSGSNSMEMGGFVFLKRRKDHEGQSSGKKFDVAEVMKFTRVPTDIVAVFGARKSFFGMIKGFPDIVQTTLQDGGALAGLREEVKDLGYKWFCFVGPPECPECKYGGYAFFKKDDSGEIDKSNSFYYPIVQYRKVVDRCHASMLDGVGHQISNAKLLEVEERGDRMEGRWPDPWNWLVSRVSATSADSVEHIGPIVMVRRQGRWPELWNCLVSLWEDFQSASEDEESASEDEEDEEGRRGRRGGKMEDLVEIEFKQLKQPGLAHPVVLWSMFHTQNVKVLETPQAQAIAAAAFREGVDTLLTDTLSKLLLVVANVWFTSSYRQIAVGYMSSWQLPSKVCFLIMCVVVFREIYQMILEVVGFTLCFGKNFKPWKWTWGKDYALMARNLCKMVHILLTVFVLYMLVRGIDEHFPEMGRPALACHGALCWAQALFLMRGFRSVGQHCLPVVFALGAAANFLVVSFFFMMATYQISYALTKVPPENLIFMTYQMGIMGDLHESLFLADKDDLLDEGFYTWIKRQVSILFEYFLCWVAGFVVMISMANIFIAVIGQEYEKYDSSKDILITRSRATDGLYVILFHYGWIYVKVWLLVRVCGCSETYVKQEVKFMDRIGRGYVWYLSDAISEQRRKETGGDQGAD